MIRLYSGLLLVGIAFGTVSAVQADEPVVVNCKFGAMEPIVLTIRGGMGATDNTLQIGKAQPVELNVGSAMLLAQDDSGAEYLISPSQSNATTLQVTKSGSSTGIIYHGECG